MRAALRLLASVQRSSQFLEPGAPTGLTGLFTHPSPRTTLLYVYHSTLEKLKQFPEHSVYRQSLEALTKHRMEIVESVRPAGLSEWQKRVEPIVDQHPEAFRKVELRTPSGEREINIVWKSGTKDSAELEEWDDRNPDYKAMPEGIKSKKERAYQKDLGRDFIAERAALPHIESEPSLTAEQVNEIESKIGAGLMEEVIQVAEGESELVDTMLQNKVWEDLEEQPQEGQWRYHERDTHTGKTQAP
ncbi:hypothetical protein M409DRAFT_25712 [Zasmidium cellare ATCC 36951]|uniref:Uncharacterized protein n=1 Tax=Zasmidium cellare ATCC 36951 TaxID=1080233 RepID=A0A6A6CA88_ZASCE|nr:uncharacterized protein M409DRAFT_25712 [Zasmidium cellare ATCC 36951]KAF2163935.1 hypothetical protein M409DRAFT_25712 [Zasmidium cellare ATCC 36951]